MHIMMAFRKLAYVQEKLFVGFVTPDQDVTQMIRKRLQYYAVTREKKQQIT